MDQNIDNLLKEKVLGVLLCNNKNKCCDLCNTDVKDEDMYLYPKRNPSYGLCLKCYKDIKKDKK